MKLNKVLGAYLQDLGQQISELTEPLCPMMLSELLPLLAKMEAKKDGKEEEKSITEKAAEDIMEKRKEMSPEECLACELANMLGIGDLTNPGEFPMSGKPTIKIKIKKVSSKDDLNKILKELKEGGSIDLNTMNDSLGDIFDLNSIQEIMETPMFKLGGSMNGSPINPNKIYKDGNNNTITGLLILETTKANMKKFPGITEDLAAGRAPIIKGGKKYFLNGDGKLIPAKEDGGSIEQETTLEDFLNE